MQGIIEKNLDELFPALEFVQSEFIVNGQRIDSIAYDTSKNCLVIIEYKNVKSSGLTDQARLYLNTLLTHKADFVLRYNLATHSRKDVRDFAWKTAPYVVMISPNFTKYQIGVKLEGLSPQTKLYAVTAHENDTFVIDEVGQAIEDDDLFIKSGSTGRSGRKSKTSTKASKTGKLNIRDYLAGNYQAPSANPHARKLYRLTKNTLAKLGLFPEPTRAYVKFCNANGDIICTLEVCANSAKICYNTKLSEKIVSESDFVRDVSKIGHYGLGDYQSILNSHDDVMKATSLVKRVAKIRHDAS